MVVGFASVVVVEVVVVVGIVEVVVVVVEVVVIAGIVDVVVVVVDGVVVVGVGVVVVDGVVVVLGQRVFEVVGFRRPSFPWIVPAYRTVGPSSIYNLVDFPGLLMVSQSSSLVLLGHSPVGILTWVAGLLLFFVALLLR